MGTRAGARLFIPELVGRDDEIAAVTQLVAAIGSGERAVLLIAGEAGLGKTAIVKRCLALADRAGHRVLRADAVRFEVRRPFGPFAEMLNAASIGLDLEGADRPMASQVQETDRFRAHASYVRALRQITAERPTVISVEDLHWADEASLEVFSYLAARLTSGSLLVGTYRPEETHRRVELRRALRDLPRSLIHELVLAPLTVTDIGRALRLVLPGARVDRATQERLQALSGGNPLLLEEIVRALIDRGDIQQREGVWFVGAIHDVPLPQSVGDVVSERLASLSDGAKRALITAGIIGDRFSLAILQAATGANEEDLLSALREGVRAQLVEEIDSASGLFAFRHALSREATIRELFGRERATVHGRVARALEASSDAGTSLSDLAHHFDEAGDHKKAFDYHTRAARHFESNLALTDALAHYQRAVELGGGGDAEIANLQLDSVARLSLILRQPTAAMRAAREAQRWFDRAGDARGVARSMLLVRQCLATMGRPRTELAALLDEISNILAPLGATAELALVYSARSWHEREDGDYEGSLRNAERATEIADATGPDGSRAAALNTLGTALALCREYERATATLRTAVGLADATGLANVSISARNNLSIAIMGAAGKETEESKRLHTERLDLEERLAAGNWRQSHRFHRLFAVPDWDEFLALYDDEAGETMDWAHLAIHRALIRTARNGLDHVREADEPHDLLVETGQPQQVGTARISVAEIRLITGDPHGVLTEVRPLLEFADRIDNMNFMWVSACLLAITAGNAVGDDEAIELWMRTAKSAKVQMRPLAPVADFALRFADAERGARNGDLATAITILIGVLRDKVTFDEARASREEMNPVHTSVVRNRLIELLLARDAGDDKKQAARLLSEEHAFWTKAKARWYVERLRSRADAMGLPLPAPLRVAARRSTPLTDREREVAMLVANGLTNREIAERLTLSVRTAESHVERIRQKLGFHTRAQIAAWAAKSGH